MGSVLEDHLCLEKSDTSVAPFWRDMHQDRGLGSVLERLGFLEESGARIDPLCRELHLEQFLGGAPASFGV